MNVQRHLASARFAFFLLLPLTYFALRQADVCLGRLGVLRDMRESYARAKTCDRAKSRQTDVPLLRCTADGKLVVTESVSKAIRDAIVGELHNRFPDEPEERVEHRSTMSNSPAARSGMTADSFVFVRRVPHTDRVLWQVNTDVEESCLCGDSYIPAVTQNMLDTAKHMGVTVPDSADYRAVYARLESALAHAPAKVPGLDLEFPEENAFAACSVFLVLLLGSIRSSLWTVWHNISGTLEEPWPMLDVRTRFDRLIAGLGIGFLVACPWLVNGAVIAFLATKVWSDRLGMSIRDSFVPLTIVVVITLYSSRLSMSCAGCLLRVLRIRSQALQS